MTTRTLLSQGTWTIYHVTHCCSYQGSQISHKRWDHYENDNFERLCVLTVEIGELTEILWATSILQRSFSIHDVLTNLGRYSFSHDCLEVDPRDGRVDNSFYMLTHTLFWQRGTSFSSPFEITPTPHSHPHPLTTSSLSPPPQLPH